MIKASGFSYPLKTIDEGSIGLPVELDALYGNESLDFLLCLNIKNKQSISHQNFRLIMSKKYTHFQMKMDETKINIKTSTEHKRIIADACIDELL